MGETLELAEDVSVGEIAFHGGGEGENHLVDGRLSFGLALADALDEAVNLYNDLKDKVNVKVEGTKGAYYASIRKELLEKTDELYAKLSEIVKKTGKTE